METVKMMAKERKGILGIPPLIFAIIVIIIVGMGWCLRSSYNENASLLKQKRGLLDRGVLCVTKYRKADNELKSCNAKADGFENSNRELSQRVSKEGKEKNTLQTELQTCTSSRTKLQDFFIKVKGLTKVGEGRSDIIDTDYDEVLKTIDDLIAEQLRCKKIEENFRLQNENVAKQDENYKNLMAEKDDLQKQVVGITKIKDELQEKMDAIEIDHEKRAIQQKKARLQETNVQMIDHNSEQFTHNEEEEKKRNDVNSQIANGDNKNNINTKTTTSRPTTSTVVQQKKSEKSVAPSTNHTVKLSETSTSSTPLKDHVGANNSTSLSNNNSDTDTDEQKTTDGTDDFDEERNDPDKMPVD